MLKYRYRTYYPGIKEQIIDMVISGGGIRDTAKVLKINKNTIINTFKKADSNYQGNNMFKKIFGKLESMFNDPPVSLNPSLSNDPVARQTQWKPVNDSVGNVRSHTLVKVHSDRIEYSPTFGNIIFSLMFLLAGFGGGMFAFFQPTFPGYSSFELFLFKIGFFGACLPFILVGGWMLYYGTAPIVFDKQKGFFWKGHKIPEQLFESETKTSYSFYKLNLERIHALQIIAANYHYELNLILKDGNRISVMSYYCKHFKEKREREVKSDAECLSALLKKPIWDKRIKEIVVSFG